MCTEMFSRLVMSTNVTYGVVSESTPLINACVQECGFYLRNFSGKFDRRAKFVGLFNEQVSFLFGGVPLRENVVNIKFSFSRFCFALLNYSSMWAMKVLAKATAILVPNAVAGVWRKLLPQTGKNFLGV